MKSTFIIEIRINCTAESELETGLNVIEDFLYVLGSGSVKKVFDEFNANPDACEVNYTITYEFNAPGATPVWRNLTDVMKTWITFDSDPVGGLSVTFDSDNYTENDEADLKLRVSGDTGGAQD